MIGKCFKVLAGVIVLAAVLIQVTVQLEGDKWAVPTGAVKGKTAIVTGANSGLGLETSLQLAAGGAKVYMACRNKGRCQEAADGIKKAVPDAKLFPMVLDLSDLSSVKAFAAEFLKTNKQLDLLINNAAIMAVPFARAGQVELQHATNHLGHFALTGLLKRALEGTEGARVVNHSSSASDMCPSLSLPHSQASMTASTYDAWLAYACTKRANRYFTWSLNQKLKGVTSVSCHPGWTGTSLQGKATGVIDERIIGVLSSVMNGLFAQSNYLGAQPQLYAAVQPGLTGGELVGPRFYMFGSPVLETTAFCQLDPKGTTPFCSQTDLDTLWAQSEALSGVRY